MLKEKMSIRFQFAVLCSLGCMALSFFSRNMLQPTQFFLGRYQSDDVYDGEWNLERDQQQEFPGCRCPRYQAIQTLESIMILLIVDRFISR